MGSYLTSQIQIQDMPVNVPSKNKGSKISLPRPNRDIRDMFGKNKKDKEEKCTIVIDLPFYW